MYAQEKPTDENQEISLFDNDTVKDIEGNNVLIPRCIGVYSIKWLNEEKENLIKQIQEIDRKLNLLIN